MDAGAQWPRFENEDIISRRRKGTNLYMSSPTIPQKTTLGWWLTSRTRLLRSLACPKDQIAIIHAKDGRLELEILPPPPNELTESVRQTYEQFKEAFDEMKRLGD